MAVIPTLKLRNKIKGAIRIVNETTYALNLGAWNDYEVLSARHGNATDKEILFEKNQEIIEKIRVDNPKSPAFLDAKNAYEQRAITSNVTAKPEPEGVAEYTQAVIPDAPMPVFEDRKVPVIGGSQTVKIDTRKKPGRPAKANQDEVL
jgi:hypothetical protein